MGTKIHADNSKQYFVAVQFGDENTEPVMMPVPDLSVVEDEQEKQKIIDSAWAYFQRGEFARESINPKFIEALASDLPEILKMDEILPPFLLTELVELYVNRLNKELAERGDSVVDSNAVHLKIERNEAEITINFDPPDGWEKISADRVTKLTQGLFLDAGQGSLSWYKFAEWLSINLVAGTLGDLEAELGEDVVQAMGPDEFETTLLSHVLGHTNGANHIAELIIRRVEHIAMMLAEVVDQSATELWTLEKLLGFRKLPPPAGGGAAGLLVTIDFGRLLQTISNKPEDLYRLPPRRFEELIAHIFERFGYEVHLTAKSRDGGYDISAVRKAETETRVLIECKRYTPPNRVGRPTVQRLMGVLSDRDAPATMGIIATTSSFTHDAETYINANHWKLQGKDFSGVVRWMNDILKKTSYS